MTATPNSDKSGRAERRREGRKVAQAQRVVQHAQATPQALPRAEGAPQPGLQVSTDYLLRNIGILTVERDLLREQVAQRDAVIDRLTANPETGEETPAEADEGPPRGETVD
jgi:hypothetical protein